MNFFQVKSAESEKLSLDKSVKIENNLILSQNTIAVMPNGLNWLFYCPKTGQSHPIYKIRLWVLHHLMGRLRLQNKPIGKYVAWLLLLPRVRPSHPIFRVSTQNNNRSIPMNTNQKPQTSTKDYLVLASFESLKVKLDDISNVFGVLYEYTQSDHADIDRIQSLVFMLWDQVHYAQVLANEGFEFVKGGDE